MLSTPGPTLLIQGWACSTNSWSRRTPSLNPTVGSGGTQTRWISILPGIFLPVPCLCPSWCVHPPFYLNISTDLQQLSPGNHQSWKLWRSSHIYYLSVIIIFWNYLFPCLSPRDRHTALFLHNKYSINSSQIHNDGGRDPRLSFFPPCVGCPGRADSVSLISFVWITDDLLPRQHFWPVAFYGWLP